MWLAGRAHAAQEDKDVQEQAVTDRATSKADAQAAQLALQLFSILEQTVETERHPRPASTPPLSPPRLEGEQTYWRRSEMHDHTR